MAVVVVVVEAERAEAAPVAPAAGESPAGVAITAAAVAEVILLLPAAGLRAGRPPPWAYRNPHLGRGRALWTQHGTVVEEMW